MQKQEALCKRQRHNIFTKTFQKMQRESLFKRGYIQSIFNYIQVYIQKKTTGQYQQERSKKVTGIIKEEFGGKIKIEVITLREKTYAY